MCTHVLDVPNLWLGELSSDDANDNDANNDNIRRTIHDNIGSLPFMPNEPENLPEF